MAINTDKNVYTVVFASVMVVVVGSILAFLATGLSGRINENMRFEKQQNILYAMGVNENADEGSVNFVPTDEVESEFSQYITEQIVIKGDEVVENKEAYLIDMKKQLALAKKGQTPELPLFIGEKEGKKFYVIPMYGKGLWDDIWGYIALDSEMVVQGVFFDHKGETPGLGANINQRYFMDDFSGESIMDGTKYAGINVAKGNNDPLNNDKDDNEVDALAGATITGNGVAAMIKETVNLYKDYLQTIRTN
ncbi:MULTISPECIES: Na(+)-translocating NADH-quinone reductase subunit C [Maribacter]|uniref:Na(+)-translocating NADH-quinone reductase subunit C n=1 Tax=Maribacter flavus TaxID=1658664 RepID=A0A5B2TN99_9FLAO|nr:MULTISPECIES: Na(+)-translocating NADH-quinone reductase subunit C [Maribacter]KAA2215937.1 Na(+)-translocating NADH-quinone reductase subunit C [Maribacter flavus]MDC6406499.1 Na(+)-translocating NADH-quinone reductase subunit C [Maribacter sp. PR66]MEE1973619.1 Na(+)-translocating NADH-quinone reductase subunit C [Maribacter flavus]